jgi:hypothetical protein
MRKFDAKHPVVRSELDIVLWSAVESGARLSRLYWPLDPIAFEKYGIE